MTFDGMVAVVSFLVVLIGCAVGVSGYLARTKSEALNLGEMKGLLDNIRDGVDTIRIEQKAMRNTLSELSNRIAAVEASDKAAHKRIDRLE
mgnify:FL=1